MSKDTLANYFKPILYDFHDREALVYKTGFRAIRLSYLDLYDHAYRMANWYQYNGLGKGDSILLWAPNGPECVAAKPLSARLPECRKAISFQGFSLNGQE